MGHYNLCVFHFMRLKHVIDRTRGGGGREKQTDIGGKIYNRGNERVRVGKR